MRAKTGETAQKRRQGGEGPASRREELVTLNRKKMKRTRWRVGENQKPERTFTKAGVSDIRSANKMSVR